MKAGLDGKSFLLGALAGALVASPLSTIIALLIYQRRAADIAAAPANVVAASAVTRTNPLEGTWYQTKNPINPCLIESAPTGIYVTDENGASSRLIYDPAGFVTATGWRRSGLEGEVQGHTIRWANGAVWVRTPGQQP